MPNGLHPDLMTTAERLAELGTILAAALMRLRRQLQNDPRLTEKYGLDFPTQRSMHTTTPRRRRVAR